MYLGGLFAIITSPGWGHLIQTTLLFGIGTLLIAPSGIDGTTQMFGARESNNRLRVITGILLGVGISIICLYITRLVI